MPNWKKLITSGSEATLSDLTISGVAQPEIKFNGTSDAGVDFAIRATPEGLDFYEPEDGNKIHMQIIDDGGVDAKYGLKINGTSVISQARALSNVTGNISMFTNDSGYITDGNTGWNNSYGFTTCTGTTTPSNTQTFTNKSGNISQWTNDSGYCTSVPSVSNANITLAAGSSAITINGTAGGSEFFTTNQGIAEQITIDHADTSTQSSVNNSGNVVIQDITLDGHGHVTGLASKTLSIPTAVTNNNQLTNGCGYITDGNTNWNNSYGYTTCTGTTTPSNTQTFTNKGGNISQWTNDSGYTTCTGTTTASNTQTFTNKAGNISQWTNDSGYITDGNTGWNNSYGFTTCSGTTTPSNTQTFTNKSGNISQWTNDSGYITSFTNTVDMGDGFKVVDGDGTSVIINENKYIKFVEGAGIDINFTDTSTGSSTDPFDLTFTNTINNNNQLTNGCGYITDGNTGWNNSYGFTTCTGTTTPSNTQTFTNKSGNISQWTNDSGYITDGNTGWNNTYGYTTCTGTTTPSNTQTFTNKSGNISQWTNNSGYTTCTGTSNLTLGTTSTTALAGNTTVNDISVANLKTRLAGGFGSDAVSIGDSNDTVTIPGNLVVTGTTTTNNVTTVSTSNGVVFEGNAADANEGTLLAGTLTADRTYTLPNQTGTIAITSDIPNNNNQISNGCGYITDGNTGWNNSYGFTTCTGTTTPSNSQTFTNKGGNISQWTNNSGYTTCTGTTTPSNTQTFTNKGGNISQWTNDSGYITDGNTGWNNTYGYTTCTGTTTPSNTQTFTNKSGNISQWTNNSGYTTCTGDITGVTAGTGICGGGTSGTITVNVDYSGTDNIIDSATDCTTTAISISDRLITTNNSTSIVEFHKVGDLPFTSCTGDITGVTAGNGLTGGGTSGTVTLNIGAGTGIDVAANAISVDVSDFMSNGSNNRILTATGTDAMNAESNLTYDGSSLTNYNGNIGIIGNSCVVLDSDEDGFTYLMNDTANDLGYGANSTIFGGAESNGIRFVLVEGETEDHTDTQLIGGCIMFGASQTIGGACSSIAGGKLNQITQTGTVGKPSSCFSFIGGGCGIKLIDSYASSVVGGTQNFVSGSSLSVIAGGQHNCIQKGYYNMVGAGISNKIGNPGNYTETSSVIVNGNSNKIDNQYGTNTYTCSYNFIGTGMFNCVNLGCASTVLNGAYNQAAAQASTVLGGCLNTSCADFAAIVSGVGNSVKSSYGTIVGGFCNSICATSGFIGNGHYNCIYTGTTYSTIGGGYDNCVRGCCAQTIAGGSYNTISVNTYGEGNTVGGGRTNCITGYNLGYNTIVGGRDNCISSGCYNSLGGYNSHTGHSYVAMFGCNLTSTTNKTLYANNATFACHLQVGGTTTLSTTTGRIDATNDIVAFSTSDRRLKCNIKPIENALCKLIEVSGNTFDWKELSEQEENTIHGNKGNDVGVIAQEIEEVLPQAVTTRDSGYKAVNYEKIIPLLIEAIKDQQIQINKLKDIIDGSTDN